MIGELPRVERLDAETVRTDWLPALARVASGEVRLLIERDGTPLAALISADDFKLFLRDDRKRREQLSALYASWEAFKDVPPEEIEREIEKATAEVRAERRARKTDLERLQDALARTLADVPEEKIEADVRKAIAEVRAERERRRTDAARSA